MRARDGEGAIDKARDHQLSAFERLSICASRCKLRAEFLSKGAESQLSKQAMRLRRRSGKRPPMRRNRGFTLIHVATGSPIAQSRDTTVAARAGGASAQPNSELAMRWPEPHSPNSVVADLSECMLASGRPVSTTAFGATEGSKWRIPALREVIAQAPATSSDFPARVRRIASRAPMARRRAVSIVERMSA